MNIILASPRGFCAGVNMAIESLDLAIQAFGTPVYVYHEIVHNQYVVERFLEQGVVFAWRVLVAGGGQVLCVFYRIRRYRRQAQHGVGPLQLLGRRL